MHQDAKVRFRQQFSGQVFDFPTLNMLKGQCHLVLVSLTLHSPQNVIICMDVSVKIMVQFYLQ